MAGTITLSVEIELGWGLHQLEGNPSDRLSPGRQRETAALEELLLVCEDCDIPVSFDVVGHLLLESCSGSHDGPYPEGWFDPDPGGDVESHPLFYAPDLVCRIQASDVDHEVCTHTFSHVPSHTTRPEVLDWELQTVGRLHADAGLPAPRSFVPPLHAPPQYDVLERNRIRTVRLPVRYEPPVKTRAPPDTRLGGLFQRVRHSHPAQVLFRSHPIRSPRLDDGIAETLSTWHASLTAPYLPNGRVRPHPIYRGVPVALRQRAHRRYLRQGLRSAVEQDDHAHFWTHLYNLANDAQWPPLRAFLERISERQESGEITVETMESVGETSARDQHRLAGNPN